MIKPRTPYIPPSATPGIPHVIEGQGNLMNPAVYRSGRNTTQQDTEGPGLGAKIQQYQDQVKLKDFTALQAARSRIKPLEDPEAQKAILRKQAARRKLRGRLGTILSDNTETLG